MQLGIKNRLRLISLLPILILFSLSSYYVYNSYISYQSAQELYIKLNENKFTNNLMSNLSRERGLTVMYLGNSSDRTHKSLQTQRNIVDKKLQEYSANVHTSSGKLAKDIAYVQQSRKAIDKQDVEFDEVFNDIFGVAQNDALTQFQELSAFRLDDQISALTSAYLNLIHAKNFTGSERDFISYTLARSTAFDPEELNTWLSLIGKADAIYIRAAILPETKQELDEIFKDEDNLGLFEDITTERTEIMQAVNDGLYATRAGSWFSMLTEKINLIDEAEIVLLTAMDRRASEVQNEAIQILSGAVSIWIISIIIALLGLLMATDIAKNIKNLEAVLNRAASGTSLTDDNNDHNINLDTSAGTTQAYALLESIIEQTRQDKQFALEASEAKSMFLANMSHEIRTPLNGIVGFTELLKDTDLHDEQREFIEIIEKSSENLLEIINNILDLSKIESNKLEIEDIVFNPLEEFESAVEVYAVRAAEKHIDLGCFIDPSLQRPIKGDPTKIKEVIINLLSNAVKFTNNGGAIDVNIRREETDQENIARVRFEVQDSGIGVTAEQKAKIFEAFGQADTSITRKYGGTGLGLTISTSFIDMMGGQLDLESQPGEGTTFFFTLEFEEIETLNESTQGSMSNLHVLMFDNEEKSKSQSGYLKEYFDFLGVKYTFFRTLGELYQLESRSNYDMIFVDYDFTNDQTLLKLSESHDSFVLIAKSYFKKKIDALNLNILKTLYEPLNGTKLFNVLESLDAEAHANRQALKGRKKITSSTKFAAKALIAEDNVINQKLIRRTLEDLGLDITLANNGLEAFEKRKSGQFDVIFMDIQMPVLDGVEATMEILEFEEDFNQPHVPIIALTANALKGDRERFLEAGMDEYTTKPLVRTDIMNLLNQFVGHTIIDSPTPTPKKVPEPVKKPAAVKKPVLKKAAPKVKPELIIEDNPPKIEISEPKVKSIHYAADILLAKKGSLENKLFGKLLTELGYTFESVKKYDALKLSLENKSYKAVLFDKEMPRLNIKDLHALVNPKESKTAIVMMVDPANEAVASDKEFVDDIIKNIINKDLLRLIFEKHI